MYKIFCDLRWSYVLIISIGLVLLYAACDTADDIRPAQGKTFIKLFGGNGTEVGKDIALMPDGGFVMTGSTTSDSEGTDVFVVRTDNIGNVIWQNHFGATGDDMGNSVIIGDDGNIYICGEITQELPVGTNLRDVYVLSLSIDGSLLSEHTYGDSLRDEYGTDIHDISGAGAGFLITSIWLTNDTSTYFISETDNQLIILDKRSRYINPSAGGNNYSARAFSRTDPIMNEPPYIATGSGQDIIGGGGSALKVFKFQASYFNSIQDDTPPVLYGEDNANSFCTDVEITADGGYIMCGYTDDGTIVREMIVKVNKGRFLEEAWKYDFSNRFNRSVKVPDQVDRTDNIISTPGICQTNDGGFILISTLELDDPLNDEISLLKLNFQGEEEWRKTFGSNDDDMGADVIQLEDGSYVIVGTIGFEINPDSGSKLCLIKLSPEGELVPLE